MLDPTLTEGLAGLPKSATLAINERSAALQRDGRLVYRFGLGQSPFPVPEVVVAALRAHAAEKDYLPVEGLWPLREAVASFHRRLDGAEVSAEGVMIGPGSKELMFLTQLAFGGQLVLPTPCWVSYGPQARIAGREVLRIPTSAEARWRLTGEQLAAHCAKERGRPRLLILNYPGNPDGDTYCAEELQGIAAAARAHGVIVLSDEIYGLTHHRGEHVSIARFYPEGTIISGGLSKWCGAGGWRLGTMTFPPALAWLQSAVASAASESFTSVSAPIQYAAITAFECGSEVQDYLAHSQRVLATLGAAITERLRGADVQLEAPQGAFYLWLDFSRHATALAARGIRDSPTLCERLLQDTGVAILPGAAFERRSDELTARLAYVDFDGGRALEVSAQAPLTSPPPEALLTEACARVIDGIDALCAWLQG
ncbi:MAG: pyridoxal phosphate-dependent aminotransferase [Myxococcota bacterium]